MSRFASLMSILRSHILIGRSSNTTVLLCSIFMCLVSRTVGTGFLTGKTACNLIVVINAIFF